MKYLIATYLFLMLNLSFGQRPDLTIGVTANTRFLDAVDENAQFFSPGGMIHFHLSKRSKMIGAQLGYWGAMNNDSIANMHHVHLDILVGAMIVKTPAFKLAFNLPFSNVFSVSSGDKLQAQNLFNRYSIHMQPELSFRYKYLILGVNYTVPLIGTLVHGPGVRLGCTF